ncbi:MAG: MFS transporter [Betaproteobacteria bacterium]|nr:MFS transporter [Betaproteobacteria bacterium]
MSETKAASGVAPRRRIRVAWSLFDFCNSFVIINGSLYISQWVTTHGIREFWYGFSFAASTVALLLTAPVVGWIVDRTTHRVTWLRWQTVLITLCAVLIPVVVLSLEDGLPRAVAVLILFFFLNYFYQTSLIFYDSMLPRLITGRSTSILSGVGEGLGHFGSIVGIFLVLPLVTTGIPPLLPPGGIFTLAPAGLISGVTVLVVLCFLHDREGSSPVAEITIRGRYRESLDQLLDSTRDRTIRRFLLAFYLYGDAILSVQLFIPIYLREVWSLPSEKVALTVLVALITAGIGAMAAGALALRYGIRRLLVLVLWGWCVGLVGIAFAPSFAVFLAFFAPCGLLFGAAWALSRAYLAVAGKDDRMGLYFGLYSVAERFSAILGPLIWGAVVWLLADYGQWAHRSAMLAMAVLLFAGVWVARGLPEPETVRSDKMPA